MIPGLKGQRRKSDLDGRRSISGGDTAKRVARQSIYALSSSLRPLFPIL